MKRNSPIFALAPALLLAAIAGCDTRGPSAAPKDGSRKDSASAQVAASPAAATADQDTPGLKELDEADRKLAERQKYCPKTGELLGSMGKPYKMTLNGRTFFLCCDGCEEAVKKEPEKYLKKLDELVKDK